jgi:hypothetical protein
MRVLAGLCAGLCIAGAAQGVAQAADLGTKVLYKAPPPMWEPRWFVEGNVGAAWSSYDDLKFLNPIGTAFTTNPVSGNFILLDNKSLTDTSVTGGAAVGYFFTNTTFAKLHYQYFGSFAASGFASFPGLGAVRQDLRNKAQGLLVGLGTDFNFGNSFFIEPVVEIGVGFLDTTGVQGANIGLGNVFPSQSSTNFVAGGGLGVGYHLTRSFDITLNGNYYWLGRGDTGVTPNPAPGTFNPGEQLQAKLGVTTLTLGGRLKF